MATTYFDKPLDQDVSAKADKVSGATSGNFAALDSNGNLTDSGHKHGDYITSLPNASTSQAGIVQLVDGLDSTDTNKALTANQGKSLNTAIANKTPKMGYRYDLNVSISNATFTTIVELDLQAGIWIVIGTIDFGQETNGIKICMLTDNPTSTTNSVDNSSLASGRATISFTRIFYSANPFTAYLRGYQNSGNQITANGQIHAVRLDTQWT